MIIKEKQLLLKNNQSISIRSPLAEDSQILLEHFRRVFKAHYKNFNRPPEYWDGITVEKEASVIQDFIDASNKFYLCAFLGDKVIGCISVTGIEAPFQKLACRLGMGIESEFQKVGLGTKMLEHALTEAKKAGFHSMELSVRTFNSSAIALYEKVGFRRVGEMKEVAFIEGNFYDEYIYQILL